MHLTLHHISLKQERIKCAEFERDLRKRLEADKKSSRENLRIAKLSLECDYAEQLKELTEKCSVIQKQEKKIKKGKITKNVQTIERLEKEVAHSHGRWELLGTSWRALFHLISLIMYYILLLCIPAFDDGVFSLWFLIAHSRPSIPPLYLSPLIRYEKLRRRNALEMEGYNNETAILRLRLAHVEKVQSPRLAVR